MRTGLIGVVAASIAVIAVVRATSEPAFTAGLETQTAVAAAPARTLTEADCAAAQLGTSIPREAIGEPVSAVTLTTPAWTAAAGASYCAVTGSMAPVDTSPNARAINFRVVLPATWDGRAVQLGGGGMNGVIPNLTGPIDGGANGPARGLSHLADVARDRRRPRRDHRAQLLLRRVLRGPAHVVLARLDRCGRARPEEAGPTGDRERRGAYRRHRSGGPDGMTATGSQTMLAR